MNLTLPPEVNLHPATVSFLEVGPKKLLINGRWEEALSGETFDTHNPATGDELAEVALAGVDDVERAVQAARAAFEMGPWRQMSGEERGQLLWKLADLIEDHADQLAELETLDNGKPLRVARKGDLVYAVKHIRYNAGLAGKIEGETIPVSYPNQLVYTLREPYGVVGLIIPWNFPILTACWKLAQALACGNSVILKPAEETPLSALRIGELIQEAGFPDGVVNILTGPGDPTGSALSQNMGIDKISFTGSTEVGRRVLEAAARSNLKSVTLELGGKSPNVIFADADLDRAIKGATWAVFSSAGQECVAGSRLFVERPVYQEVLEGISAEAQRIRVGNGLAPRVHIGPIISDGQLKRILRFIEAGQQGGAEVMAGGQRLGGDLEKGSFLAPTVFAHQDDSLSIVQEEIFGPVVAVTPFDSWEELVQRANSSRYGLAAGVWTQNLSQAHRFAQAVRAGTVWINGYGMIDPAAPFGGYKESGIGREMGKEAIHLYTQTKTVWVGL